MAARGSAPDRRPPPSTSTGAPSLPPPTASEPSIPEHDDPHVLEIRVHGIANTPPAEMLGLEAAHIVRSAGDSNGSFWTPLPEPLALLRRSPMVDDVYDHRLPPPGVRREAYSWGALARLSTVPGLATASGVLQGLVRALWVLIIPFGMVNAAYWARDLEEDQEHVPSRPEGRRTRSGSGPLVRIVGLALTLLWTATAATVLVRLVGTQCFVPAPAVGPALEGLQVEMACAALPDQLDAWARWTTGQRLATTGLLSLVLVLGLALISFTGVARFERRVSPTRVHDVAVGTPDGPSDRPILTRPGFWDHWAKSWTLWLAHLSAAMSLLTIVLAWPLSATGTHGWALWALVVPASLVILLSGVAASAAAPDQQPAVGPGTLSPWPGRSVVALGVAATALLVWCLVVVVQTGDALQPRRGLAYPGDALEVLVPGLVTTIAVLVVGALGARTVMHSAVWVGALAVVLVLGLVAAASATSPAVDTALRLASLVVVAALAVVARRSLSSTTTHRGVEGWSGRAPAVFLALAAGFAMILTSSAASGAVEWLERPAAAERTHVTPEQRKELAALDGDPLRDPVVTLAPERVHLPDLTPARLSLPLGQEGFAALSSVAVAAFLVVVGALLVRMLRWRSRARRLAAEGGDVAPADDALALVGRPGETWASVEPPVRSVRRVAALAHRAEPVLGVLATLLWFATAASVFIRPFSPTSALATAPGLVELPVLMERWSTWFVLTAFGLLLVSVVAGGAATSDHGRPWGLLWDLTCFLPRVAHPFAAPCYAERVVPELRARVDEWLGVAPGTDDRALALETHRARAEGHREDAAVARRVAELEATRRQRLARRRVVVAAHSLGAVVAVATVFARWTPPAADGSTTGGVQRGESIALLTFGTQLRPYFGRFFPELFGPRVLGTEPTWGANLHSPDPWVEDRRGWRKRILERTAKPFPAPVPPGPGSLVGFLSHPGPGTAGPALAWRSLWRRTDFIGFPVDAYPPAPGAPLTAEAAARRVAVTGRGIDHYEAEVDETAYLYTVATHGGDQRTPEYRQRLVDLIALLEERAVPPAGPVG